MSANQEGMNTLLQACAMGDDIAEQLLIIARAIVSGRDAEIDALCQMKPRTPEWNAMIAQLADDSGSEGNGNS